MRSSRVLAVAFACGAIPFAQVASRIVTGTDLRRHGAGTVSGTALYEVAGFGPLALAGCLEVVKGGVGPWLAGRSRPMLGALAAAAAVIGHNWSPLLGGKGGRGISPSLGAALVMAPEGAAVLATGLGAGRLVRQTALGSLLAYCALFVVLGRTRGRAGVRLATALTVPMLVKRVLGNDARRGSLLDRQWRHEKSAPQVVAARLLFDRDSLRADDK